MLCFIENSATSLLENCFPNMLGSNEDGGVEWEEGHWGNISNEICKTLIWIPSVMPLKFVELHAMMCQGNFHEAHEQFMIKVEIKGILKQDEIFPQK